jgi:K+-sensing histidine kinase KdpD
VIPAYLDSILLNIISNAIKYKSDERELVLAIKAKSENGKTLLSIKDNGIGVDLEKNAEKLFGMYQTFHGNKDARGFGLYITKNQIEAMDGAITVTSKVNVGSIFNITFVDKKEGLD